MSEIIINNSEIRTRCEATSRISTSITATSLITKNITQNTDIYG